MRWKGILGYWDGGLESLALAILAMRAIERVTISSLVGDDIRSTGLGDS